MITMSPLSRPLVRRILPLVVLVAGCASAKTGNTDNAPDNKSAANETTTRPATAPIEGDFDPKTVVATVAGTKLTLAELDKTAVDQIDSLRREHFRKLAELREQALDAWINDKLLEAEAKRQGLDGAEALLKREVEDKLKPVDDAAAQKFYTENSDRMDGMKFADIKERIKSFLTQQARTEAYGTFIDSLRKKSQVVTSLPVTRHTVDASGPSKGPADAPITIVEFSDYECPYCSRAQDAIKQVFAAYPNKVRLVFKDFPLDFHENAPKASEAAHCADKQGKYWEMHDKLFANQQALGKEALRGYAKAIDGLDVEAWSKCFDSGEMAKRVSQGLAQGRSAGVNGTPAFFVNGILLSGARPFSDFKRIIDSELARPKAKK